MTTVSRDLPPIYWYHQGHQKIQTQYLPQFLYMQAKHTCKHIQEFELASNAIP